jgi:ferric iron reductase protein FhuF
MNTTRQLEKAAIAAHARGERWEAFWQAHAEQVRQCEPYSHGRYRALVNRLLSLVVSGDSVQRIVNTGMLWGNTPWDTDDCMTTCSSGAGAGQSP